MAAVQEPGPRWAGGAAEKERAPQDRRAVARRGGTKRAQASTSDGEVSASQGSVVQNLGGQGHPRLGARALTWPQAATAICPLL